MSAPPPDDDPSPDPTAPAEDAPPAGAAPAARDAARAADSTRAESTSAEDATPTEAAPTEDATSPQDATPEGATPTGAAPAEDATPAEPEPPSLTSSEASALRSDRRQVIAGKLLFSAGGLTLAIGLGAVVGWYAGDRGVRFLPSMLGALTLLWIAALAAMLAGSTLLGPLRGRPRGRRRSALAACGIVVLAGLRVAVSLAEAPSPLTSMDSVTFHRVFAEDAARFRELDGRLAGATRSLEGVVSLRSERVLSADEEAIVLDVWEAYVHGAWALDDVRSFYEDYYRFDTGRTQRDQHLRSYLLTFAAELSLYEHTAKLIELVEGNANARAFLNLARPERGLAAGSLAFVREELAGLTDLSRVVAGRQYLRWLALTFNAEAEARAQGYGWLWDEVTRLIKAIQARDGKRLAEITLAADFAPIKRSLKALVFPIQKEIAEAMGDTKVRRKGTYLIPTEQLDEVRQVLEPGDVLLGRKNWYLSNLGLPGFWPHAMLYTGDEAQLRARFDADPGVLAWVAKQPEASEGAAALTFTDLLIRRYPNAWRERRGAGEQPLCVIEAVSEGVLQHDLPAAAGDYLAALRPRLPVLSRALAVLRAFAYLGRPYDFDFDFATDHALVCSEVVWRSYRPLSGHPGLDMPTVDVAGRPTVPPQEFAKRFDLERELPEGLRLFDFVLFVDALEGEQRTVIADEVAFRATAKRTKWDVRQK